MILSTIVAIATTAPAFDVEAATRAYLDTLQGAARAKSDAYFEGGYWIMLWSALLGALSYWAMLRFGWSATWRDFAAARTRRPFLQALIYAVPFVVVGSLLLLPWDIYDGFFRERNYGLMNQSFGAWLGEQATVLIVNTILLAVLIAVVFAVIRKSPRGWWLWGTGTIALFLAFFILISPIFISPLFNTYKPMAASPLRDQILGMAHAQKIPADNVYVFDASKQTKRVSANVSGLGPTIRISLNDNLLNRSSPASVKAVMGHEMGHYVLNHVEWLILEFSLIVLAIMFLMWWSAPRLIARFGARWGVHSPADLAAAPIYGLIATLVLLVATPLINSFTRIHESQADVFGLDAAREPDGFAEAAMQLSEYRKIEPSLLEEALFFDHPSGRTRVHLAMAWKAAHLGELPADQRGMVRPPSASSIPPSASATPAAASHVQR